MNYHDIKKDDMSNGDGLRVTLFLSGCNHHCEGCHNTETWGCDSGIEFDINARQEIIELLKKDYISGLTLSGGDPLHKNNLVGVLSLLNKIRILFGDTKSIWLYSGYKWEEIFPTVVLDWLRVDDSLRKEIVSLCDVFVDGRFVKELADVNYKWAGSKNQRVIDVQKSLQQNNIVLKDEEK